MRIAAAIFALTGAGGLILMSWRFMVAGFQIGGVFAVLLQIALLFQAWQLWTNRPNARKSAIATAVVLIVAFAAELSLLAWYADVSVGITETSPLQATLISLWGGIVLYGAAAFSLIKSAGRPNKLVQGTRSEQRAPDQ